MRSTIAALVLIFASVICVHAQTAAPAVPAGQQIGVTSMPAPIVLQEAAPAKAVLPLGDYASEALAWVLSVFGTTIGAALTALIVKLFQKAGVETSQALRAKLQEIVENGVNLAASEAGKALQGKGDIEIENQAVASAITYVQAHAKDTLKALGVDPSSAEAKQAIRARVLSALAKPTPVA